MKVWRLMTHHEDPAAMMRWAKTSQRLAIGWGLIGDLGAKHFTSDESIKQAIRRTYPGLGNAASGGKCLWDFWKTMRPRDLIILSGAGRRGAVMRVTGPYQHMGRRQEPPVGDYVHQRE